MSDTRTFFKRLGITLSGLFVLYALAGWLLLPRIIQYEAPKYVLEKTGYRLSLDLPRFNPFTFEFALSNLHLDAPDGKSLLSFSKLDADLSASGILRRTLVLQSVDFEKPDVTLVIEKGGKSNWQEFMEKLGGKGGSSSASRIELDHFRLARGRLDFRDENNGFSTRIEPVEIDLSEISTLPGKEGQFRLSARTDSGADLVLTGKMGLSPVILSGNMAIRNLDGKSLSAYLKGTPVAFGKVSVFSDFRITDSGKADLDLSNLKAQISKIKVAPAISVENMEMGKGSFDLAGQSLSFGFANLSGSRVASKTGDFLRIDKVKLEDVGAGFSKKSISVARIRAENGRLDLVRNRNGGIDLPELFESSRKPEKASPPWHYLAKKISLSGFSANLQDKSADASLKLKNMSLALDGASDNLSRPLPVRFSLESGAGGRIEADGKVIPSKKSADLNLKVEDLSLDPAQPYLSSFARLLIASGKADAQGHASYDENGPRFAGQFDVKDLRLLEKDTKQVFLSWKSLSSPNLSVTGSKLDIGLVDLDNPYAKLIIAKNKSVNISDILEKRKPGQAHGKATPFQVNIDRIRVKNGEMDYADYSLALPFGTRIHKLRGFLNGISSAPGALGQMRLIGRVDRYGSVRAAGQIDLFDPKQLTDIKVKFNNIEMTRLTPYSATFAGRKIDSGKLTLDLDYKIKNHMLTGNNQIIMDNLTLGERVRSPQAKDLPLDLAIAVLQDSNGRINLGLPVSGSLDDPKFSYGAIIWKAISNVLERIVTAPFRLLGSLFGGGQKFENIVFDAGRVELAPPEEEKLSRLANALRNRPGLFLTVHGVYSDADRMALQDLRARRAVAIASGQHIARNEDPGPLARTSPAIRNAIEKLFSERFGEGELSAIRQGFRKANPGKMQEGTMERIRSELSGLFRKKRTLSEEEVEKLKGADFYSVLYGRLRDAEPVLDAELQRLGEARGNLIESNLKASGVPDDRMKIEPPVKVQGTAEGIPVKLELGAR